MDNGAARRLGKSGEPRIFICRGASTPSAQRLAVAATVLEAGARRAPGVAMARLKAPTDRRRRLRREREAPRRGSRGGAFLGLNRALLIAAPKSDEEAAVASADQQRRHRSEAKQAFAHVRAGGRDQLLRAIQGGRRRRL